MSLQVCVLASGSAGNSIWIRAGGTTLLLDAGLHPDDLDERLAAIGTCLDDVDTLVVSHLHGDHLHGRILRRWWAKRGGQRLWCHSRHAEELAGRRHFRFLASSGYVRYYDGDVAHALGEGLSMRAFRLPHDADPTYGFHFTHVCGGDTERAAFLTDTGSVPDKLIPALADVDILGLEFNHDPGMLARSGRPAGVIRRIRGPLGHLSNGQAAAALERIVKASPFGGPGLMLLLHLSRECNRPTIAKAAAGRAMAAVNCPARVVAARQDAPDEIRTVLRPPVQKLLFEM